MTQIKNGASIQLLSQVGSNTYYQINDFLRVHLGNLAKMSGKQNLNSGIWKGLNVYYDVLQEYLIVFFLLVALEIILGASWILLFWPLIISYKGPYAWSILILLSFRSYDLIYPWLEILRFMAFSIMKHSYYDDRYLFSVDNQIKFLQQEGKFILGLAIFPWFISWLFPWAAYSSIFLFTLISPHNFPTLK